MTFRALRAGALVAATAGLALPVLAAPVTGAPAARVGSGAAPVVTLLVVGPQGTIVGAQRLRLTRGRVPVPGAGACPLAPGTALDALDAARRRGRLRYGLRGQSTCTPETFFVDVIDSRRNVGDGGWEYKVDGRTPAVGAGVPANQGGARVHAGSRVLWFFCRHANRCQATLELHVASQGRPGAPLAATVLARDDNGRDTPVNGAIVTLAGAHATTDAVGVAHLTTPARPGRYTVGATASGLVDAFPEALRIG